MLEPAIQLLNVRKSFGKQPVLQGVNLAVERGQIFALLGRNGAGKTTTIRMLLGLLPRDGGSIAVLGRDPQQEPIGVRAAVGFLAEDQQMFGWMTIGGLLSFLAPFYPTWDHTLADRFIKDFELPRGQKIKHLSKGQNVRLGLVLALAHRPELVILDDPALGLDPIMRKEFNRDLIAHLQGEGATVLYSSHLLYEVEPIADSVAILHRGVIIKQAATEALRQDVKQIVFSAADYPEHASQLKSIDVCRQRDEVAVTIENAPATIERLVAANVRHRVIDLNLDDIFAAYVIGKPESPGPRRNLAPLQYTSNSFCLGVQAMSAILRKLAWKEYQELKWGVLAAIAIALAIPLSYVFRDTSSALMGVMTDLVVYPGLAGIFFGMRVAAGERTNRGAGFVASLPVSHHVLGAMRLGCAVIASFIPLLVLVGLAWVLNPLANQSGEVFTGSWPGIFGLVALATVLSITIVARAGIGQPTEIRAGLVGFVALLVAFIVSIGAFSLTREILSAQGIDRQEVEFLTTVWYVLLEIVIGGLLATTFIRQYSRALGSFVEPTLKKSVLFNWQLKILSPPMAALMSKAVREMGVIGVGVLAASVLLSVVAAMLGFVNEGRSLTLSGSGVVSLPLILFIGGFALAVLIGVGAVIGDVQPGVNTFWRSRPISPQAWYWTKYVVGLITMLLAIEIPVLLLVVSGNTSVFTENRGVGWWLLVWNCTFSFALTATCLVRQPGYAAILAVGGVSVIYAVLEAVLGSFLSREAQVPMAILGPMFVVTFFVSTVVGWWAAVTDVSVT